MAPPVQHVVYGTVPPSLVAVPADAVQCSPWMAGSVALETLAPASLASAVVHAPEGTMERRYVFAHLLQALAEDAPFTAVALKDKGGRRMADALHQLGCPAVTEDSRHHYRICTTRRPTEMVPAPALIEGALQYHPPLGLWTQPGVFSWDRIDAGSALLLQYLPHLHGTGADLGCGLGILSQAVLASPDITRLTLVDRDRRAVEAAARNVTDPRAAFLWADACDPSLPLAALDFVVMNPPFHALGVEDKTLGQRFIAQAAALLARGGQCWLTANRHLPYETLLRMHFARVRLVAEANGFKIYAAEK